MTSTAARNPPVLLVDPGNFTPGYDMHLAAALARDGWPVEWISSEYAFEKIEAPRAVPVRYAFFRSLGAAREEGGLPLIRRLRKGLTYAVDIVRFRRALAARAPGIVHMQWSLFPWLDAAVWARLRATGWRLVYTAHDVRPLAGTLPRSFERGYSLLLKQADAVVVHSQAERAAAVQLGAIPERLHVIAPAPPFLPIEPVPTREQARIKLGLRPDDRVVLFFGFIKPYKGLAVLLRSLPVALGRRCDLRLIVAGQMMEPRGRYEAIVDELRIAHAVHWIRGYVPSSDVAAVFAAADVVALPYLDASSSGVLLTAYALGRPVIATAVGGLPELVEAGRTGLLVPPGDTRALGEAIASLLADPDRAREMGACGLDLLERRFTWGAMARHVGEIYRQLVADTRRVPTAHD